MNEELLDELSQAMKRRDKAAAAIARWQEQKNDAEEDIRELSARITDHAATWADDNVAENPEPVALEPATWAWSGEQEPAPVQE